ncbi:MAG TPA: 2-amino-4-hydroxy-6-hydroxymethyldihydropteridine diphosphokinase [Salinivirgaceae bacterium]|nr:2-amino-4-hydroxy-6-hydroxymethyldihydropteridine diphosphokinase [Salinivirgaceae bacterium]
MNNTAILSLGSNIEPRQNFLSRASESIDSQCGTILKISSVYQSEAWGFQSDPFLNLVLILSTTLNPFELLSRTQAIEREMGRVQKSSPSTGYASRTIDIDILFFNNWTINTPQLVVPHPQLNLRKFVLVPLCELLPDFIHPIENKTIQTLLQLCPDQLEVKKVE